MRIHSKVVIDIETGEVLSRDSFDYEGPVILCKESQVSKVRKMA